MELIFIFFTALFIGFSGAVVPGPLLSVTVNESLRRGISAGPLLIVGHALLEIVIIAGLVYGLSQILESPLVGGILGVWGALCCYGWVMVSLKSPGRGCWTWRQAGMRRVLAGILFLPALL